MNYPQNILLSVDILVLRKIKWKYEILLITRKNKPNKGWFALPGGMVEDNETVEQAAMRELKEETDIAIWDLSQLHVFSKVDRDPRARIVSVAFYTILDDTDHQLAHWGDDALSANFYPLDNLPWKLAVDHWEFVDYFQKHILEL